MKTPALAALLIAASTFCGPSRRCTSAEATIGRLTDLHQILETATHFSDAGLAYNRVLPKLTDTELRELSRDLNTSLALQAYAELHNTWRENRKATLPDAVPSLLVNRDKYQFLGFLAGRTGLIPPRWWENAFGKPYTDELLKYRQSSVADKLDRKFLEVPTGTELREHDGQIVVRIGERECVFPITIIDCLNKDDVFVSRACAGISGENGVLAFYDRTGPCYLFCARKGVLRWQSVGWGQGSTAIAGGYWAHDAEIVLQDDIVAVFGSGTGGPYVEAFDLETGQNRFRFSREYWFQRSPRSFVKQETERDAGTESE
jgi:hypothetical protein